MCWSGTAFQEMHTNRPQNSNPLNTEGRYCVCRCTKADNPNPTRRTTIAPEHNKTDKGRKKQTRSQKHNPVKHKQPEPRAYSPIPPSTPITNPQQSRSLPQKPQHEQEKKRGLVRPPSRHPPPIPPNDAPLVIHSEEKRSKRMKKSSKVQKCSRSNNSQP